MAAHKIAAVTAAVAAVAVCVKMASLVQIVGRCGVGRHALAPQANVSMAPATVPLVGWGLIVLWPTHVLTIAMVMVIASTATATATLAGQGLAAPSPCVWGGVMGVACARGGSVFVLRAGLAMVVNYISVAVIAVSMVCVSMVPASAIKVGVVLRVSWRFVRMTAGLKVCAMV